MEKEFANKNIFIDFSTVYFLGNQVIYECEIFSWLPMDHCILKDSSIQKLFWKFYSWKLYLQTLEFVLSYPYQSYVFQTIAFRSAIFFLICSVNCLIFLLCCSMFSTNFESLNDSKAIFNFLPKNICAGINLVRWMNWIAI